MTCEGKFVKIRKRGDYVRVLICALNSKFIHSSLAPWYLKASAKKHCDNVECEIYETTINESKDKIVDEILQKNVELVAFSVYIWNASFVMEISREIKAQKNVKILFGGPEVSYNAKQVLSEHGHVDYIISGEGELPFAMLCAGAPLEDISGLCYRGEKELVIKPPHISCDDPPSPYTEEYLRSLNGRISYIETSRGCPYRCAFCLSGRCGGVRFFDLDEAKRNILLLANSGTKTVKFIDRTFNADKKRANEIFKFIIEKSKFEIPKGVCFHFEIEGNILDDEIIDTLSNARAGLFQMEIGLQSFNKETLSKINRKTNTSRLKINVQRLLELGNIHIHLDLIAGLPCEDLKSFSQGFNEAISLGTHVVQLGFLKLLHGSKLREKSNEYGLNFDIAPPYEVRFTPWISESELEKLHIVEDIFDRLYNSGRFSRTVRYIHSLVENAFGFYLDCGMYVENNEKTRTLDEFSELVYKFTLKMARVDPFVLRDCMAQDRLATNRMGVLPEFLKVKSPKIKEILVFLDQDPSTRRKKGIKRSATILKSEKSFVYVDYDVKNLVTNEYKVTKLKI